MKISEDCPEFLKPRLRLFLSADIVGSTALKQSKSATSPDKLSDHYRWYSVIQGFYIEARRAFIGAWEDLRQQHSDVPDCFGEPPELWKTIGDEVLFVKVLSDYRQLAVTLKCWVNAADKMRSFVKGRDSRLDVKCAGWIAGFPIRNKEVVLSYSSKLDGAEVEDYYKAGGALLNEHYKNGRKGDLSVDYVGPSIDIGFRVAASASPRKFVLSIGIPYILSLTNPTDDGLIPDFHIFYDGAKSLKGVLGGVDYPIFWIDMSKQDTVALLEDKLTGSSPAGRDDIRRYCESFYKTHSAYTFRPFIHSTNEQQILVVPPWYEELHANLVRNFLTPETDTQQEPQSTEDEKPVEDTTFNQLLAELNALISSTKDDDKPDQG